MSVVNDVVLLGFQAALSLTEREVVQLKGLLANSIKREIYDKVCAERDAAILALHDAQGERDMWQEEFSKRPSLDGHTAVVRRFQREVADMRRKRDELLEAAHQHVTMGHADNCNSFWPHNMPCHCGFDLAREAIKQAAEEQEDFGCL